MPTPLVSVIIPAHNGADLLGKAIQSVLDQSYTRLEVIVVDDGSVDSTADVVGRFSGAGVKYLSHERSRGPCAARFTGLQASRGDIVAFLDQDDLFHREKLAAHVAHFEAHPHVGFTYNPFFALSHPSGAVLGVVRPPATLALEDLVLGFPLPPSAWVLRRQWARRDDIWDPATHYRGREIVLCGRLFLAGCRFSLVDRALYYRRFEADRAFADPASKCEEERRCQQIILDDPRCPPSVQMLRNRAFALTDRMWATVALIQDETETGRHLLRRAAGLSPDLFDEPGAELTNFFVDHAITVAADPEGSLRRMFSQLPPDFGPAAARAGWAVGLALVLQAAKRIAWGSPGDAEPYVSRAEALGVQIDDATLRRVTAELLSLESEYGEARASEALDQLGASFRRLGGPIAERRLRGACHLGRAFRHRDAGHHRSVPGGVVRAFLNDPRSMGNRGAWSILVRSGLASRLAPRGRADGNPS